MNFRLLEWSIQYIYQNTIFQHRRSYIIVYVCIEHAHVVKIARSEGGKIPTIFCHSDNPWKPPWEGSGLSGDANTSVHPLSSTFKQHHSGVGAGVVGCSGGCSGPYFTTRGGGGVTASLRLSTQNKITYP